MAWRALLDYRELPQCKRTQTIDNGTKQKLGVTYMELNESKVKWLKRNDIFILKFKYSSYIATQIYTALDSSKIKRCPTTSIMLHVNKVIPRRSKRSQSRLRLERAPIDRSGCLRTREILLWVSWRTDIWLLWVLGCLRTTFRMCPQWASTALLIGSSRCNLNSAIYQLIFSIKQAHFKWLWLIIRNNLSTGKYGMSRDTCNCSMLV